MGERWSDKVKNHIETWIQQGKSRPENQFVVFDADGTLWKNDIGESFFQHQIKHGLIPQANYPQGADLWELYLKKVREDSYDAYGWLAQLQAGLQEETLRKWTQEFFNSFSRNILPEMKNLVQRFKKEGFDVWICSASMRWAVEPGAHELGIENFIAIETQVKNGIITANKIEPLPYKKGKKLALQNALAGVQPFLVIGNSTGDLEMLEWGQNQLIIGSAKPSSLHFQSEQDIQNLAQKKGWPVQVFE